MITSQYIPNEKLLILVRETTVHARTRPQWDKAIDEIESFANLSEADKAWLSGVRWMGLYTRPYV